MSNRDKIFEKLILHIEKEGFDALRSLTTKEMMKPLIYRDWQGTDGKLGYRPLAEKYNLSVKEVRTICGKFIKRDLIKHS